jgi:hypothetical protein
MVPKDNYPIGGGPVEWLLELIEPHRQGEFAASYIPGSDIYACGGDAYLVASSSHWAYATGNGGCGGGGIGILQVNHTTGGSKIFPANTNEYFGDGVHSLQACFVTSDLSASYGCGPAVYYYG